MKPLIPLLAATLLGATLFAPSSEVAGNASEPSDESPIKPRKSIKVDDGILRCVALSPDGKLVACCGDQFLHLFDVKSGERLNPLDGHTGAVNHVAFAPDGKLLASAGEDQTIRLWDIETGQSKAVLKQSIQVRKVPQTCLAFSAEGKTLVSCSSDRSGIVWLWDVEKLRWEHMINTPHLDGCWHVTFAPDGKYVAAAGAPNRNQKAGQVSLYVEDDGPRFVSSWKYSGEESATCVSFSPDSATLASTGFDNTVRLWDVKTGQERLKLSGPQGAKGMRAAAYLPGGERIVSVTFEETIQLWDATKGTLLATTRGMDKGVRSMVLSPDGKTLATCGEDKVIKLWDMPSGAK